MKTKKIRTNIDSEYVFRRASEGTSALQISKELGCSRTPIITFFQQNGLAFKKKVYNLPADEVIRKYKEEKIPAEKALEVRSKMEMLKPHVTTMQELMQGAA